MTRLGTRLGTALTTRLGTSFSPRVKALFQNATFVNATPRMISYGTQQPSVTSFAANVLATRVINGRRFAQVETATENKFLYSQGANAANWVKLYAAIGIDTVVAPDGDQYADKVYETAVDNIHAIQQYLTPTGSTNVCVGLFVEAAGRYKMHIRFPATGHANTIVEYNLSTGQASVHTGTPVAYGIEDCGGGWYFCWMTQVSIASPASTGYTIYLIADNGDIAYVGDGSSGINMWQMMQEEATFPSSTIYTTSSATTRNKDELSFAEADVPAPLRGKITFQWIPYGDNTGADRTLIEFDESGASSNIHVLFQASDDKITVVDETGSSTLVASNALTFSRMQMLTVTLNPAAGTIEVTGATAGDGLVAGTAWSTSAGDVYYGMNESSGGQCDGLISEPY